MIRVTQKELTGIRTGLDGGDDVAPREARNIIGTQIVGESMSRQDAVILILLVAMGACGQAPIPPSNTSKPPVIPAQPQKKNPTSQPQVKADANDPAALWYERAQRLTNELEDDQWKLHMLGNALPARLAEAWWKVDNQRAQLWLDESVQGVTYGYRGDKPEIREERIKAAAIVFAVANQYDRAGAEKIAAMLVDIGQQGSNADRNRAMNSLKQTLMPGFSSSDSTNAGLSQLEIGEMLIKLGDSNLQMVLGHISWKDPDTANRLFSDGLATAQASNNYHMFWGLAEYVYPTLGGPSGQKLPESSRADFLNAVANIMLRAPQSDQDREQVCKTMAPIANRLFDKFPPAQAGMVQTAVQNCNAQIPNDHPQHDCSSVDDCLKVADLAQEPSSKAELKEQAAAMSSNDGDPVRALDILDSLTPEEQKARPGADSQRISYLVMALQQLYKVHDTVRIQRLLDDAPDEQRAQALLSFAAIVMHQGDKPYGQLMLSQARTELEKRPSDNPHDYVQLLLYYAQDLPEDALPVFGEVVNGLNQIKYKDPKNLKDGEFAFVPLGDRLELTTVPAAMLEKDDAYVFASIKGLDDPRARVSFRLGCLRTSLKQYQQLKNAKPKQSPGKVTQTTKK